MLSVLVRVECGLGRLAPVTRAFEGCMVSYRAASLAAVSVCMLVSVPLMRFHSEAALPVFVTLLRWVPAMWPLARRADLRVTDGLTFGLTVPTSACCSPWKGRGFSSYRLIDGREGRASALMRVE